MYDVIIIGSGLSGLECATILSKEGLNVCVLEQSNILGGCLQSFKRKGYVIDTGMHYIGSMDKGQIMHQYFKYFGIDEKLNTIKLDDDFENIYLGNNNTIYKYRTGYNNFIEELSYKFPKEKDGITKYCDTIKQIGSTINIDVHRGGQLSQKNLSSLSISAAEYIEHCVKNPTLQNLLAATNPLYGANKNNANLYHHAMINHSNIEGAYRCIGGTQQIADLLIDEIKKNGGSIFCNSKVTKIGINNNQIDFVELQNKERISAKYYISTIHPTQTFSIIEKTSYIKQAYKTRLNLLPNTHGIFSVYLIMKENSFPYINHNKYFFKDENVWDSAINNSANVNAVLMSSQISSKENKYSDVTTLMSLCNREIFKNYEHTKFGNRGKDYTDLKNKITKNIIDFTCTYIPDLKQNIDTIYSSSPLTYEHYTLSPQGSAYGILKDYHNSIATLLPTHTKIPNLFLSGQNLNVHGAIGVTLTAANSCANILGEEYLAKKITSA